MAVYGRFIQGRQSYPATSLAYSSSPAAGSHLVGIGSGDGTFSSTNMSTTPDGTWTAGTAVSYGVVNFEARHYHVINSAGGAATPTLSTSPSDAGVWIVEFEDDGSVTAGAEFDVDVASSTTPNAGAQSPVADGYVTFLYGQETTNLNGIRAPGAIAVAAPQTNHVAHAAYAPVANGINYTPSFATTAAVACNISGRLWKFASGKGDDYVFPLAWASSGNPSTGATTLDVPITLPTGTDYVLCLVATSGQADGSANDKQISGVEIVSGSALSLISGTQKVALDGSNKRLRTECWGLASPGTGAVTLRVTFSTTANHGHMQVIAFKNVDSVSGGTGATVNTGTDFGNATLAVTPSVDGAFIVGIYATGDTQAWATESTYGPDPAHGTGYYNFGVNASPRIEVISTFRPFCAASATNLGMLARSPSNLGTCWSAVALNPAAAPAGGSALLLRLQTEGLFVGSNH